MFESLTSKFNLVFEQLRRRGILSEADVDLALREVRLALLEADVHYSVVKSFLARVRERAIGKEVSKALNPGQQVVKIVNDELIKLLGEPAPLNLIGQKPRVILMAGLQGSGKTTTAVKLASLLRSRGERVMLVAGDPYRPAAVTQLIQLGQRVGIPVETNTELSPPDLAARAFDTAQKGGFSVLLVDSAGRSQLDVEMMSELKEIHARVNPVDTLLVVDAMTGQDALHIALGFREAIPLTGLVLTKMDGDARGGAAISFRSITGIPIKFLGVGEKLDQLEVYDPSRISSRILGMGDVLGLIKRAEAVFDAEHAQKSADRFLAGQFTLEDWLSQMKQVKKLGSLASIMEMLPGQLGKQVKQSDPEMVEQSIKRSEAIINSMSPRERRNPEILNASRRRRIANGSGCDVQDVNRLMKQFREMQKMMKTIKKSGTKGIGLRFG